MPSHAPTLVGFAPSSGFAEHAQVKPRSFHFRSDLHSTSGKLPIPFDSLLALSASQAGSRFGPEKGERACPIRLRR